MTMSRVLALTVLQPSLTTPGLKSVTMLLEPESGAVMKTKHSRLLVIVGLVLMVLGVLDPLEGSVVILAGSALVAIGAFFSPTGRYALPVMATALIGVG